MTLKFAGYETIISLYQDDSVCIYRGIHSQTKQPVIIKVIPELESNSTAYERLQNELLITAQLEDRYVLRAIELVNINKSFALIFEDFDAITLKKYIEDHTIGLVSFLNIAIGLCQSLASIHQKNIIHKDIKPSNILIHPDTQTIKITDFGISVFQNRIGDRISTGIHGTLAYISPEQTGRMAIPIDTRSDIYSLGITLYELLTKQLPFPLTDSMELVHAHLAKMPPLPHTLNPEIPSVISRIVMRCLNKNPNERFQSAIGLKGSFEECLAQLNKAHHIQDFSITYKDVSTQLLLPDKLYGHQSDIDILKSNFIDICNKKEIRFVAISGPAGIGKSTVVQGLKNAVLQKNAYFISGQFELANQSLVYSAFIQAFQKLIHYILTESSEKVYTVKLNLQRALGSNAKVITDLIPELELIIGVQASIPELTAEETWNRFNWVLDNFLDVFSDLGYPLVIFLDNLQWADSQSLRLLNTILTESQHKHLLLIGAFRGNEVIDTHPLMKILAPLKNQIHYTELKLAPLTQTDLNAYISDTLYTSPEQTSDLADIVFKKTHGNPLFLAQFLKHLYSEKWIWFNFSSNKWDWDMRKIRQMNISDDLVDLMITKLQKLTPFTCRVLAHSACIANDFPFQLLKASLQESDADIRNALHEAISEDLIIAVSDEGRFKFSHDKIYQMVYSRIEDPSPIHYQLAHLMMQNADPLDLESSVLEIITQFNQCLNWVITVEEQVKVADFNVMAAKKIKNAGLYEQAIQYIEIARSLLPSDSWETHYDLTLDMYFQKVECEFLLTNFEESEKLFALIQGKLDSKQSKVSMYILKIKLYSAQNKHKLAVQCFLDACDELCGYKFQFHPSQVVILKSVLTAKVLLRHKSIHEILALPKVTDENIILMVKLFNYVITSVYYADKDLFILVSIQFLILTLQYGYSEATFWSYLSYLVIQISFFHHYKTAHEFTEVLKMLEDKKIAIHYPDAFLVLYGLTISHWVQNVRKSLHWIRNGMLECVKQGNLIFSSIAAGNIIINRLIIGDPLPSVLEDIQKMASQVEKSKYQPMIHTMILARRFINRLTNGAYTSDHLSLDDSDLPETQLIEKLNNAESGIPFNWYYLTKLRLLILFHQWNDAYQFANQYNHSGTSVRLIYSLKEHYFLNAIVLTQNDSKLSFIQRIKARRTLNQYLKSFQIWRHHTPDNVTHQYCFILAELNRIKGNNRQALLLYEQAIESALENRYIHNAGLFYELVGKWMLSQNQTMTAGFYLKEAKYCYAKWGSIAKVNHLLLVYPEVFGEAVAQKYAGHSIKSRVHSLSQTLTQTNSDPITNSLDMVSILKASQTISGEMLIENLLEKLMGNIIENAGARKGFFIVKNPKTLGLVIKISFNLETQYQSLVETPLEECHDLAYSIVQYVVRTKRNVVIDQANLNEEFQSDPYILNGNSKSIFCTAIIYQGKLTGVLYLENNLIGSAFTEDRIAIIQLLSSQAAISLDNAKLYQEVVDLNQNLEKKVDFQTQSLQKAYEDLQITNLELESAKKEAEAANRFKSQFLAQMTHELRTPLHVIIGTLDKLLKEKDAVSPKAAHLLDVVLKSGERQLGLVNDILDISKLESGKMEIVFSGFEFTELLVGITEMMSALLQDKSVKFEMSNQLPAHFYINTDKKRLQQIMTNVLGNAAKFTEKGTINLTVTLQNVQDIKDNIPHCPLFTSEQVILITVEDTGLGLKFEDIQMVFKEYSMVNHAIQRTIKGTGLGLAISKKLVELLGGTIWVESEYQKGSRFKFCIPYFKTQSPSEDQNREALSDTPLNPEANLSKNHILLCDDDEFNLMYAKMVLDGKIQYQLASSGKQSIELMKSSKFDLVLMDIQMPEMDGKETLRQIRTFDQETPVIALTAQAMAGDREELLRFGFSDYFSKPFKEDDLVAFLTSHLYQ